MSAARPDKAALPIDSHLDSIVAAVREHGACVVVAEPGAGKTTRVPGALLDTIGGEIVCTQPRRMAARLSAQRVAEQRGSTIGQEVGYELRFERKVSAATRLRFVTEGLARRQWPFPRGERILILDEFHERHLDADILLALAAAARKRDPSQALVVMSATLDADPISEFLGGCPIIESQGRQFPVELVHQEPREGEYIEVQVSRALKEVVRERAPAGHVLVFLPGVGEIRRCRDKLEELARSQDWQVLPLHGGLSPSEQDQVLRPSARRKIILATNVAETSVTIEGVTAVIDSGLARVARVSPWTGLSSLEVEPVSQASAKQRMGRAGRTAPGLCVRLFSKHDSQGRRGFDSPEVVRTDLAECDLFLRSESRSIAKIKWLSAPPDAACEAATQLLVDLQALHDGTLTAVGTKMAKLPLHPRLSRLLIEGHARNIDALAAQAAALLSDRPLRHSKRRGQEALAQSQSDLADDIEALAELRRSKFRGDAARRRGLDLGVAKNADKVASQLLRLMKSTASLPTAPMSAEAEEALCQTLLAGFPDRAARRVGPRSETLLLCRGGQVTQSRSSAVLEAEYVVALDVEARGRQSLVRSASAIDPSWLFDFPHLRDVDEHIYEADGDRVVRRTGIFYGDIAIDDERIVDPTRMNAEAAKLVLLEALLNGRWQAIVDKEALEEFRRRVAFVRTHRKDVELPELDDRAICQALISGVERPTRLKDLVKVSLVDSLYWSLPQPGQKAIDTMAPTHVALPGRKRVPVHYEADRPPWIESRLQDFFGLSKGPAVAGGGVPLVLHLLAPNYRAVQVTTDLEGFWQRHYPELRKQLMRRYPKHKWPETP